MIYLAHLVPLPTNETSDDVRIYFERNLNFSIRKVAQVMDLKHETFRKIVKDAIKLYPYKIITHQFLTKKPMKKGVKFCKVITDMFENEEFEKQIILTSKAHIWLNEYFNKQSYQFCGKENPNVSIANFFPKS